MEISGNLGNFMITFNRNEVEISSRMFIQIFFFYFIKNIRLFWIIIQIWFYCINQQYLHKIIKTLMFIIINLKHALLFNENFGLFEILISPHSSISF